VTYLLSDTMLNVLYGDELSRPLMAFAAAV